MELNCKHDACPLLEIELIPLTQGKYAIVDRADYQTLSRHTWYAQKSRKKNLVYYSARRDEWVPAKKRTKGVLMHRQIMGLGKYDNRIVVDHANHNALDNRRSNLRKCTQQNNCFNRKARGGKTSKYKGVHYRKNEKKWVAELRVHLGYFNTQEEAAIAYNKAAELNFGEFAYLNKFV